MSTLTMTTMSSSHSSHHYSSHGSSSSGSRSSSSTVRPSKSEDWEPYRDIITDMYSSMKLKDVMSEMQRSYAFKAT
jgi:hypothetical protein